MSNVHYSLAITFCIRNSWLFPRSCFKIPLILHLNRMREKRLIKRLLIDDAECPHVNDAEKLHLNISLRMRNHGPYSMYRDLQFSVLWNNFFFLSSDLNKIFYEMCSKQSNQIRNEVLKFDETRICITCAWPDCVHEYIFFSGVFWFFSQLAEPQSSIVNIFPKNKICYSVVVVGGVCVCDCVSGRRSILFGTRFRMNYAPCALIE